MTFCDISVFILDKFYERTRKKKRGGGERRYNIVRSNPSMNDLIRD